MFSLRNVCTFWLALTPVFVAGCDDDFNQDWVAVPDTVVLFSLSRPELLGRPSAFDFFIPGSALGRTVIVENPAATGEWDIAVTDQGSGLAIVPASAFAGLASPNIRRTAIAAISGVTFEAVAEAPGDTASYVRTPVLVEPGKVYVVRSRRSTCGFGSSGSVFAKLEALEIDAAAGSLRFRTIINPFCNDRRLIPPD